MPYRKEGVIKSMWWDTQGIKWEDRGRGSVVFVVVGQEPRQSSAEI